MTLPPLCPVTLQNLQEFILIVHPLPIASGLADWFVLAHGSAAMKWAEASIECDMSWPHTLLLFVKRRTCSMSPWSQNKKMYIAELDYMQPIPAASSWTTADQHDSSVWALQLFIKQHYVERSWIIKCLLNECLF